MNIFNATSEFLISVHFAIVLLQLYCIIVLFNFYIKVLTCRILVYKNMIKLFITKYRGIIFNYQGHSHNSCLLSFWFIIFEYFSFASLSALYNIHNYNVFFCFIVCTIIFCYVFSIFKIMHDIYFPIFAQNWIPKICLKIYYSSVVPLIEF